MIRLLSSLRWMAVLVIALATHVAHADNYYIDSVNGSDANDGRSPDAPLKSMSRLLQLYGRLTTGFNVINIAGDHVGSFDFTSTRSVIQQWPGRAPARIRGSHDPIAEGYTWTLSAGTTYRCEIGPDRQVSNVCARWGSLLAKLGRTAGWYRVGTLSDGALTADQRYYYDEATGFLYFRDDAIGDPSTLEGDDRVCWQDRTLGVGLDVRDPENPDQHNSPILVSGLTFMHYNTGRGACYGLLVGGVGHVVADCTFYDCEVHAITLSNTPSTNCQIIRCVAYGAGAGVIGVRDHPSLFVTHTPIRSADADVVGCRYIDCVAYCYGLSDPNGVPHDPNDFIHGFYGHTSGFPGSHIADCEFRRCVTVHYTQAGYNFYCGDTAPVTDPYDFDSYPVRAVDCVTINGAGVGTSGNLAFRRCFFDFSRAHTLDIGNGGWGNFGVIRGFTNLLESCIIVGDTRSEPNFTRGLYRIERGARLIRINCTSINVAPPADSFGAIISIADGSGPYIPNVQGFRAESYGCIDYFLHDTPNNRYFFGDGPASPLSGPDACYVYEGNWIHGVSPGQYSHNPMLDTLSEFTANLDANAVMNVDPLFVDPASTDPDTVATLLPKSPVRTATFSPSRHAAVGYNGAAFGGQRGAIQLGGAPCPCDVTVDGRLDSQDFFHFLVNFFAGDADFNNSGATDSQDFFAFLECFFSLPEGCNG